MPIAPQLAVSSRRKSLELRQRTGTADGTSPLHLAPNILAITSTTPCSRQPRLYDNRHHDTVSPDMPRLSDGQPGIPSSVPSTEIQSLSAPRKLTNCQKTSTSSNKVLFLNPWSIQSTAYGKMSSPSRKDRASHSCEQPPCQLLHCSLKYSSFFKCSTVDGTLCLVCVTK